MLKKSLFITAIISVFLSSCGSVSYTQLTNYTPKNNPPEKEVDLYYTKRPDKPYKEVCKLSASKELVSEEKCLKSLKYKAKELGLDAIIIVEDNSGSSTTSTSFLGTSTTSSSVPVMRAIGIIYE